ncbi:MAG: hypothetical protein EOO25_09390 [Comamonadaceae bacterium]|nr:MAG: hypothetical protein EOO25_09390 [Comamonadaceae bacterium]
MPDHSAPKDGDFAAYLQNRGQTQPSGQPQAAPGQSPELSAAERVRHQQTFQPTEQDLIEQEADRLEAQEDAEELANPPDPLELEITDEELERQALSAPGADGDPRTPE